MLKITIFTSILLTHEFRRKETIFQRAILQMMKPIVKLLIRQNIPFSSFTKIVKHLYVHTANEELAPRKKIIAFKNIYRYRYSKKRHQRLIIDSTHHQ